MDGSLAGSGVQSGTGLTEAHLPNPLPSPSTLRKGKSQVSTTAKLTKKRSRKSKGKVVLHSPDSETDEDVRREDDVIMRLIESGCNLADIDRLYCVDGMSAGDVERLVSMSATLPV